LVSGLIRAQSLQLLVDGCIGLGINVESGGVEPSRPAEDLGLGYVVGELEKFLQRHVYCAEVALARVIIDVVVTVGGGVVLMDGGHLERQQWSHHFARAQKGKWRRGGE
jgi:hypothetical protein